MQFPKVHFVSHLPEAEKGSSPFLNAVLCRAMKGPLLTAKRGRGNNLVTRGRRRRRAMKPGLIGCQLNGGRRRKRRSLVAKRSMDIGQGKREEGG